MAQISNVIHCVGGGGSDGSPDYESLLQSNSPDGHHGQQIHSEILTGHSLKAETLMALSEFGVIMAVFLMVAGMVTVKF